MSAIDDLDAALAKMQGDDSGGPLGPALDAARRVRTAHGQLQRAERRIRDEVFRVGARVAATVFAVGALLADGTDNLLCMIGTIVCLICAGHPSKDNARKAAASLRAHPWVWAITAVLGIGGGITIGHAIGRPSPLTVAVAAAVLALGLVWVALILRAGARGRKATA